ncbi:unnamed protein product [Camellia sinensis]
MPLPAMATPKLLLSKPLRRRSSPTLSSLISSSSSVYSSHISSHSNLFDQSHNLTSPKHILPLPPSTLHLLSPHYNFLCFRFFSTRGSEFGSSLRFASAGASAGGDGDGSEVAEVLVNASASAGDVNIAELILSVRAVVSLLDYCHDFTGLPWYTLSCLDNYIVDAGNMQWVIIASSTLVLRITLLPMLILQLEKLKKLAELFPKSVGCASYLWFLAYFSVQGMIVLQGYGRRWIFQEQVLDQCMCCPVSFWTSSESSKDCLFRAVLQVVFGNIDTTYNVHWVLCTPGGSLVFWLTNSSLTLIQQLSLNHPNVHEKLGLPHKAAPVLIANCEEMDTPGEMQPDLLRKERKIRVHNLSAQELLVLSLLAKGHKDRAIPLLRLALEKDPDYVRGLIVMGQTLLQSGQLAEATEYLERAISKWAGVAYIRQERHVEGIKHLERVANLKERKDSKRKAHYYDAFILLARYELRVIYYWSFHVDTYTFALLTLNGGSIGFFRALYKEGRKAEAAKYLHIAIVYDFAYNVYLEQCDNDDDKFVGDLVNSRRRGDY